MRDGGRRPPEAAVSAMLATMLGLHATPFAAGRDPCASILFASA